jgi:hypothetical protein
VTRRVIAAVVAALCVLLLTHGAAAEPPSPDPLPVRTHSPGTLHTDGGSTLRLPPVVILSHPQWNALDDELRRAQDAETRLGAENDVLRRRSTRMPGALPVIGALALGIVIGAAAFR